MSEARRWWDRLAALAELPASVGHPRPRDAVGGNLGASDGTLRPRTSNTVRLIRRVDPELEHQG